MYFQKWHIAIVQLPHDKNAQTFSICTMVLIDSSDRKFNRTLTRWATSCDNSDTYGWPDRTSFKHTVTSHSSESHNNKQHCDTVKSNSFAVDHKSDALTTTLPSHYIYKHFQKWHIADGWATWRTLEVCYENALHKFTFVIDICNLTLASNLKNFSFKTPRDTVMVFNASGCNVIMRIGYSPQYPVNTEFQSVLWEC